MNSSQSNEKSRARKAMTGGLVGALLLAIGAFFATAGVQSRSAASESPAMVPASESPADDVVVPGVANADEDTLDLQLG